MKIRSNLSEYDLSDSVAGFDKANIPMVKFVFIKKDKYARAQHCLGCGPKPQRP